jgi:hypothetical protein
VQCSDSLILRAVAQSRWHKLKETASVRLVEAALRLAQGRWAGGLFYSQVFLDVFCKTVVYFSMASDGLFLPGGGIEVDVMPRSVPMEHAPGLFQLPDQFGPLHNVISFTW